MPKAVPIHFGPSLAPEHRVFAGFALHALAMGSLFPRLPDVQEALGVGEGALGLSLMGTPVGTLAALTFGAPVLERVGFRRVLLGAIPLVALLYAVAVRAPTPEALFALLVPVGAMIGCVEIVLNLEADRTEALVGRRIMNRAHAFWSLGFFGAGLFGAAMARLGVSPQAHLALMVPVVAVGVALSLRGYLPAPARLSAAEGATPRFARPTGPILVLVAVTLSALLMEGAGIDWSAIYMRDAHGAGPFTAGLAVAVVALSQAGGRFVSDRFVDRHGPVAVARAQLGALGLGLALVVTAPGSAPALVGFALLGLGTSAIFPLAMSAAAQRTDRAAAVNVAALAQVSFVAFLAGPPLLGLVAEGWDVRWAFAVGAPLVVLSLVTAGALGRGHAEAMRKAAA